MKKIIFLILLACSAGFGQGIKKGKDGNYYADTTKTAAQTAKATGKFFFDYKGNKWPVFESKNGKLFALRTSKNGKEYKMYLKN